MPVALSAVRPPAGHPAGALAPVPDGADGRFAPLDSIAPGALAGLLAGLEEDRRRFLATYADIWQAVGDCRRTRLDWARMNQILRFADAMLADGIEGDFAEFGVWKGGVCFAVANRWAHEPRRRILGFDSFRGLPEPDARRDGALQAGVFGDVDLAEIRAFMQAQGVGAQVELIEGWFEDTIGAIDDARLALCHVDADCYESVKLALERAWPRMTCGGYIIFDDYLAPMCAGATIAVEEFFAPRRERARMTPGLACSAWVRKEAD
ncbi:MAG: TylF/MycF/NovP-related O-methyltransferase [Phycisphaerales bacterium JB039]